MSLSKVLIYHGNKKYVIPMQRNVPSIVHLGHIDIFVKDALLE